MEENKTKLATRALAWQLAIWLLTLLTLFLPAGTLTWPAGWTFFVTFFGFVLFLSGWLLLKSPSLLEERLIILRSDQRGVDKVWLVTFYLLSLGWLAIMPIDAVRLHWLAMSSWVTSIGMVLLLCSLCGIFLTLRENSYASPVIRVQEERGHTVVSAGLYRYIRHPLYAAAFLFYTGVPLLLESWCGLALAPVFIELLVLRAVLEERVLLHALPGYDAYMKRVTRRFILRMW
jgi:protein-S-isoprenylcysteine O-methyltransferase Ste14